VDWLWWFGGPGREEGEEPSAPADASLALPTRHRVGTRVPQMTAVASHELKMREATRSIQCLAQANTGPSFARIHMHQVKNKEEGG
jgi:hypothetical protein